VLTWSRGSIGVVGEVFEVMTQVDLGLTNVSRFDSADFVISVNDTNLKPGASQILTKIRPTSLLTEAPLFMFRTTNQARGGGGGLIWSSFHSATDAPTPKLFSPKLWPTGSTLTAVPYPTCQWRPRNRV
jgi:hypothetical protein